MKSPKRLARIAGLLYLINGIFGGFAFAYVIGKVYAAGDAAPRLRTSWRTPDLCALASSPTCSRRPNGSSSPWPSGCCSGTSTRTRPTPWWSSSQSGPASCASTMSSSLRACASPPTGPTWPPSAPRVRVLWCCSCSKCTTTASSSPRSSSACGWCPRLSRLQIRDVSQGAGRLLDCGRRLLPRGPAGCVPGPRRRRDDQRFVTIPSAIAEISMVLYLLVKGVRSSPQIEVIDRSQMPTVSVPATA